MIAHTDRIARCKFGIAFSELLSQPSLSMLDLLPALGGLLSARPIVTLLSNAGRPQRSWKSPLRR